MTSLPGDSLVGAFACDAAVSVAMRNPSAGLGGDARTGSKQLQPLNICQGWDELHQDRATEVSRPVSGGTSESCLYVWQQVQFLH